MNALASLAYAAVRIISGLLFFCHGTQKLFGFPVEMPPGVPPALAYSAGSIELIGGALIALGLFTRPAAFLCSGQMAVAYWIAHGTKSLFPLVNGGELAVLYCFLFLFVAAEGAGPWSVDKMRARPA
jgi:putative oxidoreductase